MKKWLDDLLDWLFTMAVAMTLQLLPFAVFMVIAGVGWFIGWFFHNLGEVLHNLLK